MKGVVSFDLGELSCGLSELQLLHFLSAAAYACVECDIITKAPAIATTTAITRSIIIYVWPPEAYTIRHHTSYESKEELDKHNKEEHPDK